MNKVFLKEIISEVSRLKVLIFQKKDVLLYDRHVNQGIIKGFRLSESQFAMTLSIWITPVIHFRGIGGPAFQCYELNKGNGSKGELRWNFSNVAKDVLGDKVVECIKENINVLDHVSSYHELVDFLSKNEEQWLISPYSKVQYALTLLKDGRIDKAVYTLESVQSEMVFENPIAKQSRELLDIIKNNDYKKLSEYLDEINSDNISYFNNLGVVL